MQSAIIKDGKKFIKNGDLENLRTIFQFCTKDTDKEYRLNIEFIFKELFLASCTYFNGDFQILRWMTEIYLQMGAVERIALKPIFPYGKHLLMRKRGVKDSQISTYIQITNDI
uniref:Uncharacterized protein n=1 Tax=viral metagenome TaxID=1070528 RepID=A0A6C0CM42_9ZZZZ